jgi:hypothetical protein
MRTAAVEPVPGWGPDPVPMPPPGPPPVTEPEPDRLPDEVPNPNPDENDRPLHTLAAALNEADGWRIILLGLRFGL